MRREENHGRTNEPCIVNFVCADDRQEVITFQELTLATSLISAGEVSVCHRLSIRKAYVKKYEHPPHVVMLRTFIHFPLPRILDGIRPQTATHQSVCGQFPESIDLRPSRGERHRRQEEGTYYIDIIHRVQLGSPSMHRNCLSMMTASGSAKNDSMQAL